MIDAGQYFLGLLGTPLSIYPENETHHWTSLLKVFTGVTQDLLGYIPNGDEYVFGHTFLPWWGVVVHQHVLCNLSKTLIIIADKTST